jgi:hypothetical protein
VKQWLKARGTALLDNLLWALLLLVGAAVVASIAAWGGKDATLPIWSVVLFGAVQVACVVAIIVLFVRRSAPAAAIVPVGLPEPTHTHDGILDRLAAFETSLNGLGPIDPVTWPSGSLFNAILTDAKGKIGNPELHRIKALKQASWDDRYVEMDATGVRGTIGQVRAIVQHSH